MKTLWRVRAQLLPALLFATIPLAFLIAVALYRFVDAAPEARRTRAETVASFQALRVAAAVDQAVQDAERGQRGFLLTGRDTYLEPYTTAKASLPKLCPTCNGRCATTLIYNAASCPCRPILRPRSMSWNPPLRPIVRAVLTTRLQSY
jgi:hypothetical protein